jgi:hypothetical protein
MLRYFIEHLVYFADIWYILWYFGIFCGSLVYFVVIWYILSRFGMLYQEKSGNPDFSAVTKTVHTEKCVHATEMVTMGKLPNIHDDTYVCRKMSKTSGDATEGHDNSIQES